jgi:hypothetical protein
MKNLFKIVLIAALICASPLFADLEVPGEVNPVLATDRIEINKVGYMVEKRIDKGEVTLNLKTSDGKIFCSSDPLGIQEKFFVTPVGTKNLLIADFTGDGVKEIVTAAMLGYDRSALYIFSVDVADKKLVPLEFRHVKEKLAREFLVSDMYQEDGQDFVFAKDNSIRVLGWVYNINGAPVGSFYYFKPAGDYYVCSKIVPVPTGDASETEP